MKARLMMIGSALLASLICLPAMAQPAPQQGMGPGMGPGPGMNPGPGMGPGGGQRMGPRAPRDCSKAPNPETCQAHQAFHQQARAACQDKVGPDRRQCMAEQMQSFDCNKAGNPAQCEARKKVYQECKGQAGQAFRQCVQQKMPPVDCATAVDPQRCMQVQAARAACRDKPVPEYMGACAASSAPSSRRGARASARCLPLRAGQAWPARFTGSPRSNAEARNGTSARRCPLSEADVELAGFGQRRTVPACRCQSFEELFHQLPDGRCGIN